jgi:ABC-type Fe3+ transport system substrate-binding protein
MNKNRPIFVVIALLVLLSVFPLALRRDSNQGKTGQERRLVIITPHSESIRREFAEGFARNWKLKHGEDVYVDWRSPGGTSEIRLLIDASFKAAESEHRQGIGIDLMFGGGEPDFASQARKGRFIRLTVLDRHPEWFGENGAIPLTFTGERLVAADGTWISACLSEFGICHNPTRWRTLGLPEPRTWQDLTQPALRGQLALADPTKSGSVARAFELIIQSEMQRSLADPTRERFTEPQRRAQGWTEGLQLIQRLSANARYFTDSGAKVPLDVAAGDAMAGMCIDYFGRTYAKEKNRHEPRLAWAAPATGSTVSGDPIAVFRGSLQPELAQDFVEYVLSPEGQRLWQAPAKSPGGPLWHELHRPPVRRDAYTTEPLGDAAAQSPYERTDHLTYRPELTSATFGTLRKVVKAMCIDCHEELVSAWAAIIEAGMPADALAVMSDMSSIPYPEGGKGDPGLDSQNPIMSARRGSELSATFRANYLRAEQLARAHLKNRVKQ